MCIYSIACVFMFRWDRKCPLWPFLPFYFCTFYFNSLIFLFFFPICEMEQFLFLSRLPQCRTQRILTFFYAFIVRGAVIRVSVLPLSFIQFFFLFLFAIVCLNLDFGWHFVCNAIYDAYFFFFLLCGKIFVCSHEIL